MVEESNQEKGIATLVEENVRGELLSPGSVITTNVSQTDDIIDDTTGVDPIYDVSLTSNDRTISLLNLPCCFRNLK